MNISFSKLGHHGRLGNQLFQIASTMGIAEHYGAAASFPVWPYEKYFETPIPHGVMETNQISEKNFHFYDWELTESCDLYGYMQSEKYFGSQRLKLDPKYGQAIRDQHPEWFSQETICIHIRRGDFVGNPNYHQLSINYYIDALITNFPNWREYNIIFISDDLEYCRTHFECMPNAFFAEGFSEMDTIILASLCDHFIIANSSFGWWCAYFGEKPHSKIIHSGKLQAGDLLKQNSNQDDYYPARWIRFEKDNYKIDLSDTTFTIPVFMDHDDRKNNLNLTLHLLMTSFKTEIIICEQGSNRFEYTNKWVTYMHVDDKVFHRTKMLNQMAMAATTEYIVNWDCDVIIPPMQILVAVEELRSGADMVFPYDGRFARMPRAKWFPIIQKHLDIGIVGAEKFKGREHGHNSVGGAVMFSKTAFIDGGMENEYMISFGPEDCERNDRFKILKYDVRQVSGSLFHVDHHVGVNSSNMNPSFKANHAEYAKIHEMSESELREYVSTWPWRHVYTSGYYHHISEGSIKSAAIVMHKLYFKPKTVIDIGCGVGEWANGLDGYVGVDYRIDRKDLLIPEDHFIELNLDRFWLEDPTKYDLCICLEVAEHLRPVRAAGLIQMLCGLSDKVLFSAAIPFQGGQDHINEQWQTWWAVLFNQNGFGPSIRQPDLLHTDVELWYKNNIILYERGGRGVVKDQILPEYYEQIVKGLKR